MLIPVEDISKLIPAVELKKVSDTAQLEQEKSQVARLVNLAANTGETRAIWNHYLSDELKSYLESEGYKVTFENSAADPSKVWVIDWS